MVISSEISLLYILYFKQGKVLRSIMYNAGNKEDNISGRFNNSDENWLVKQLVLIIRNVYV